MNVGRGVRGAGALACGLALITLARADDWPAEVRVLSGPGAATSIAIRARPEVEIEDRTPGAKPASDQRAVASSGETFAGELTIFLRDSVASRSAAIEVADALVSVVRLFPEANGTTVTVFVRQPVAYTVSRPSPIGEVRIEVTGRVTPLGVAKPGRAPGQHALEPGPGGEKEVAVDAESLSYDQQTNILTARGGVTLTRGETTLTADEVVYDRTNAVAEARGNVVLTDPQATVEGDFLHLNLEDETGWVENARGTLRPTNYLLDAGRLEKLGGPRYSVARGVFTTCECGGLERPSWSIAGNQTDVKLQGAGVARGVSFRVKDVPILYLPYFVFPATTERQSGLLMPRLGYSNRRGFEYEQPFYWAINKSSDATVALDVETKARIGVVGEYRYALSRRARGSFTGAYYNESIRAADTYDTGVATTGLPPENRFGFAGRHTQPFYKKSRFFLDLFAVSDDHFLRDINSLAFSGRTQLALRSTRFTTSRTGLYRGWTRGLALTEAAYYQDLVDPEELAPQKLPRVEAEHAVPLLGNRLLGRLAGEAVHFQRRDGYDGLRGDLAPELFVPFHMGRVVQGSLSGQLRETAYYLLDQEQIALVVQDSGAREFRVAPELPELDRERTRELAEVHARTGTAFSRIFAFNHLGLDRVKHTIEPELQYLFVPPVGRSQETRQLPTATLFSSGYLFDERDAINRRNFLSWGVTSRLLGRAAGTGPASEAGVETEAEVETEADSDSDSPENGDDDGTSSDADILAQGLSADAIPGFVGPPPPRPAKGAPPTPPRELARATVLHGYDASRELTGTSHQSDVDLGVRLTPLDWLGMTYNTTVSVEESLVRGFNVGLFAREPWWQPPAVLRNLQNATTIGISYRFIEKSQTGGVPSSDPESELLARPGLNELDGSLYLRLGNYLGFSFLSRYDLSTTPLPDGGVQGPHFLERDYFVRLISRCNCWLLEAGFVDRVDTDERSFRLQFTLVGLGSFGRSPGTRSYVGFAPLSGLGLGRGGPAPRGIQ